MFSLCSLVFSLFASATRAPVPHGMGRTRGGEATSAGLAAIRSPNAARPYLVLGQGRVWRDRGPHGDDPVRGQAARRRVPRQRRRLRVELYRLPSPHIHPRPLRRLLLRLHKPGPRPRARHAGRGHHGGTGAESSRAARRWPPRPRPSRRPSRRGAAFCVGGCLLAPHHLPENLTKVKGTKNRTARFCFGTNVRASLGARPLDTSSALASWPVAASGTPAALPCASLSRSSTAEGSAVLGSGSAIGNQQIALCLGGSCHCCGLA